MTKSIKIITEMDCWNTQICVDDEDITKKISGIFGIDVKLRIDKLPEIMIHRHDTKCEYENKDYDFGLNIVNHELK